MKLGLDGMAQERGVWSRSFRNHRLLRELGIARTRGKKENGARRRFDGVCLLMLWRQEKKSPRVRRRICYWEGQKSPFEGGILQSRNRQA